MNFALKKEMSPYLEEPLAMPVGTAGKVGYLYLGFELDDNGRSILRDWERHAPLIVQQALYFDEAMPHMPCVYILSSGGPNVDGDRYEQHFVVRKDAFAHIATGAATKLAKMRYNFSALEQHITIEEGGYLEYLPEPTIPCCHTRFIADTTIRIAPTGSLLYAEIYTAGRRHYNGGERFEYDILSVCTHAERMDGEQLFREKFIIRPQLHMPDTPGQMGSCDIFANVIVLTTEENIARIDSLVTPHLDPLRQSATGISRLPHHCGLVYKVLGCDTEEVKRQVRQFGSLVRQVIKGYPLPEEFPWR